jgi:hypothetical protein
VVPIAAIAREPRGLEAQDRADRTGTELGNQAIEARSLCRAARRATEVVVDDLDLAETVAAGDFDEVVLPRWPQAIAVANRPRAVIAGTFNTQYILTFPTSRGALRSSNRIGELLSDKGMFE